MTHQTPNVGSKVPIIATPITKTKVAQKLKDTCCASAVKSLKSRLEVPIMSADAMESADPLFLCFEP